MDDDDRVRLVVLSPHQAHVAKTDDSPALAAAAEILDHRGSTRRLYRNMVVFLAADHRRVDDLRQGMAEALAWASISAEAGELDLGVQQAAQAATKATEAEGTVERRLAETYSWALVPAQPEPTGPVALEAVRIEGQGDLAARTSRRLIDKGHLNLIYAPSLLRTLVLNGPLASLWEKGHISVEELWESAARYPYLPRLRDRLVLHRCAQDGPAGFAWSEEGFALAEAYDATTRRYVGLVVGPGAGGAVSASTLLVRPDIAAEQTSADKQAAGAQATATSMTTTGRVVSSTAAEARAVETPQEPGKPRRFHGSVVLRSERLSLEFGRVVQEIIQHFGDSPTDVEVTIEISASSPEGFDESVIRTVTENARTLHFNSQGFEEE